MFKEKTGGHSLNLILLLFNFRVKLQKSIYTNYNRKKIKFVLFPVGYDSLHMKLDGKFSYLKENQRTLSFNVDIVKLPKHRTVFAGSSSE